MNLKYDIFGIVKNAGKISVLLIALWGIIFGYIFFGVELGITSDAYANIETAGGSFAEPQPQPEPAQSEDYQYQPMRIKPYTKL